MSDPKLSLYGRAYWDAEVEVPLDVLPAGKGKVDARVVTRLGGFAFNAARALAGEFAPGAVRVVTVAPKLDERRLKEALPRGVALDAVFTSGRDPLPTSVILNPAGECRILRQIGDDDAAGWRIAKVPRSALRAQMHVVGRVPMPFAEALRARAPKLAWVGGQALGPSLERACDLICVNAREAAALTGEAGSPAVLARVLAERAKPFDAIRVVTGAGGAPTAVAFRQGQAVRILEAAPPPAKRIVTLLGVGDAFASAFVAAAYFRPGGLSRALAAAQRAAGRFLERGRS